MKIELPPPIPTKRDFPKKVQPPPRSEASPAVKPLPAVFPPPPNPSLLLTSSPAPKPSEKIQPPENQKAGANTATPEPDRSNNLESITQQEPPPQARRLPGKGAASSPESTAPAHSRRSTPKLVPFLVAGGFAAFVAGLTIVAIKNTSFPPAQTQSNNSGSYSAPMTETPPEGSSTGDTTASQVTASTSESSPAPSSSVDEWELLKEDLRKRAAALSAASPTTGSEPVQPTTEPLQTYHVIKVKRGDSLKVRTGPGQTEPVVTTLGPGTRGILLFSERIPNGPTMWQKIWVGGYSGWVNEIYLEADFPRAVPRAVEAR
jgi:hypothetical protein